MSENLTTTAKAELLKSADFTTDIFDELQNNPVVWETPIPFKNINLPNFPVNDLPVVISDYVRAVSETTQTSPDMAATAALAILALSLQGKFLIEGKKDWREPLNLYTIVIAPPAERKSAVMMHMTEPLKRYEITENERRAPLIEQNKIVKAVLEKKKKLIEDNLAKGKLGADKSKAYEVAESLSNFEEIKPCRLFCDDITPEKLASVLYDNDGRTALLSSEGGIFDMLAGRYSGSVNIDVFLKAHSGDSIRVDRQGRKSEYVQNPTMTTLLFAQPNVIESIMSNGIFHGRGLCARFLYSIPNSTVGSRKFESRPIPDITSERYYNLINILLNIDNNNPQIISLSSRAYELLRNFANEIEPMLIDNLADIADFAGKFVGVTLRIAGLLYLAEYPPQANNELILTENFMDSAIRIGKYYLEHAKAAYQLMGADEVTTQCKYILRQLSKTQPKIITVRDIMRLCQRFKNADVVAAPIARLCEYSYMAEQTNEYNGTGRPQAKSWEMNPLAYENL
ncbi:MAG: YfjI family protein [Oscillospiraceae bacterium]|nr:YfjI family protein [Oscillospiraceae bacterium]